MVTSSLPRGAQAELREEMARAQATHGPTAADLPPPRGEGGSARATARVRLLEIYAEHEPARGAAEVGGPPPP
jgi:hypothetical protein